MGIDFRVGDCREVFGAEPDESFDAFVSDWPAGVAFMSRAWDRDHGGRDAWIKVWSEVSALMHRKANPGAFSLTWALPRTAHWTACALEDGGWFIQDVIVHVFGQGWPKGRAALKPAAEHWILARKGSGGALQIDAARVARGTGDLKEQMGGRTATVYGEKEPVLYTPNEGGSWPPNFVLSHHESCEACGTRRVSGSNGVRGRMSGNVYNSGLSVVGQEVGYASEDGTETVPAFDCLAACDCGASVLAASGGEPPRCACGRAMWWACPVAEMDRQSGDRPSTLTGRADPSARHAHPATARPPNFFGQMSGGVGDVYADAGGASRFFPRFQYAAKAAGGERHAGCDHLLWRADKRSPFGFVRIGQAEYDALPADPNHETIRSGRRDDQQPARARGNVHPTVKSLALMEWLVSLVCPPGGRLGDVTCGSGGTIIAADRLNVSRSLGLSALGCDICPEAIEIAEARREWWRANTSVQTGLFGDATVIESKPTKPAPAARPVKVTPPPEPDPRQGSFFT